MHDPLIQRTASLLESDVGHEIVALEPYNGRCFGFNETAAWVWKLLESPCRRSLLRDALFDRFEVQRDHCEDVLNVLLDDLEVKGLVQSS